MIASPRSYALNARLASLLAAFGALVLLDACDEPTRPIQFPRPRVRPDWVTGEAATALDTATGLFRLTTPVPQHIGALTADSLATAVARLIGSSDPFGIGRSVLERDRGDAIDFDQLHLCLSPLYVSAPFGDFPPSVPGNLRRAWGAQWAIPLCGADGAAQLSVGVPDNPTDLRLESGTVVRTRTQGGGSDYNAAGIPRRFPYGLPLTAEGAVEAVFGITQRRTITVPVAFDQHDDDGFGQLPLCGSWRLSVETPVTVVSEKTGKTSLPREFFIRRVPGCYSDSIVVYVASASQPTTRSLVFAKDTVSNDTSTGLDTVAVALTGPVLFERVRVIR
jgi:hypothetical protein